MRVREITHDTLDFGLLQKRQGHKYDHGHAVVVTGGPGRTGAARLSGRAALRIGAGAVTLAVPPSAQMEVAHQITALMLRRVADAASFETLLEDDRINALCLGPGLGLKDDRAALIEVALRSGRRCVLDADALTLIGRAPTLFNLLHEACVLTPHAGEFTRVFPAIDPSDGAEAVRAAAALAGCIVLLKGENTFIAGPDAAPLRHAATGARAVPWLATAGSGDVLAGFITGLLARGVAPTEAAALGAFLHVDCARAFGAGLIAEDLADTLPGVLSQILR